MDKKYESHCRVPPHVLSTGFHVWSSLGLGSDASPSAPHGSLGVLARAVGVTGADRADAPRPGERPEHPVITSGSDRGPDEPALLQVGRCKGQWLSREVEIVQNPATN